MIVFEAEPSALMRSAMLEHPGEQRWLRPWRLPPVWQGVAPRPLRRFVSTRCEREGRALPSYTGLELLARLWARHELLEVLASRPWLRVHARCGEGAEPADFVSHEQVVASSPQSLAWVHAVLAPSLSEAYLPELPVAAASGIPIVATRRGAGSVASRELFAELPTGIGKGLGDALDRLYRQFVAV